MLITLNSVIPLHLDASIFKDKLYHVLFDSLIVADAVWLLWSLASVLHLNTSSSMTFVTYCRNQTILEHLMLAHAVNLCSSLVLFLYPLLEKINGKVIFKTATTKRKHGQMMTN